MQRGYTRFRKKVILFWQIIYVCSFVPTQLDFMMTPAMLSYFLSLSFLYYHENETTTNPKNENSDPGYKRKSYVIEKQQQV